MPMPAEGLSSTSSHKQALGDVARAMDALERVQNEMADIGGRSDQQRRHDLIRLRRELAAQIAEVGAIANPVFEKMAGGAHVQEYRNRFSQMRSTTALHQADWPAVRLGEQPTEYLKSAYRVQETNRAFIAWMRAILLRIEQQA